MWKWAKYSILSNAENGAFPKQLKPLKTHVTREPTLGWHNVFQKKKKSNKNKIRSAKQKCCKPCDHIVQ